MIESQALAVVALVQATWPRFPLPESTEQVWTTELARRYHAPSITEPGVVQIVEVYDYETAVEAVRELARTWPESHWPPLQAIIAKVREVAQQTMSPALPAGDEAPPDPDAKGKMHQLLAAFWEGREGDLAAARRRLGIATAEDVVTYGRQRAQELLDAAPAPVTELPAYPGGRVPSPCPVGQPAAVRDGVLVCPHCGEPVRNAEGRALTARPRAES